MTEKRWNPSRRKDTPENVAKARELFSSGMCWAHIGREIGVGEATVHRWLDPHFAERSRHWQREKRWAYPKDLFAKENKPSPADVAARLAEIPADTRDLTACICGDPLPGRRAIDLPRTEHTPNKLLGGNPRSAVD